MAGSVWDEEPSGKHQETKLKRKDLEEMFLYYDKDKSGTLTLEEMVRELNGSF
jgi:Ca2+-binding EF-hand superfamily protein